RRRPRTTLLPYTPLFRSCGAVKIEQGQPVVESVLSRLPHADRFQQTLFGSSVVTIGKPDRRFFNLRIQDRFLHILAKKMGCRERSEEHTSELQSRENLVC